MCEGSGCAHGRAICVESTGDVCSRAPVCVARSHGFTTSCFNGCEAFDAIFLKARMPNNDVYARKRVKFASLADSMIV